MSPSVVHGATLGLAPASATYAVGDTFSVVVSIDSEGEAVNAISGTLAFPQELLEVTSVSKQQSIISLWVAEPSFLNANGSVSFEGVVLNPGFTGARGTALSVQFKVRKAGVAELVFSEGALLKNDGEGTNILSRKRSASYVLTDTEDTVPVQEEQVQPKGVPVSPRVTSSTHPDTNLWYKEKTSVLSWEFGGEVSAVRLLLNKEPESIPTVAYTTPITTRTISDIDEGVSYFHIQGRNEHGWGEVTHFPLHIDSMKPDVFDLTLVEPEDATEPTREFFFAAEDDGSGIDHYTLEIGGTEFMVPGGSEIRYRTETLLPQRYIALAKAFDKAGNYRTAAVAFTIAPLDAPVLQVPETGIKHMPITVLGTTYKESEVIFEVGRDGGDVHTFTARSSKEGTFEMPLTLDEGVYTLVAFVRDARGAESVRSQAYTLTVRPPQLESVGATIGVVLSILIPLIALIIALILLILYGVTLVKRLKKHLRKEVSEAEEMIHKAFTFMKADIEENIALLESTKLKRKLTREEVKLLKRLKKNMEQVEEALVKEVEDIAPTR